MKSKEIIIPSCASLSAWRITCKQPCCLLMLNPPPLAPPFTSNIVTRWRCICQHITASLLCHEQPCQNVIIINNVNIQAGKNLVHYSISWWLPDSVKANVMCICSVPLHIVEPHAHTYTNGSLQESSTFSFKMTFWTSGHFCKSFVDLFFISDFKRTQT